MYHIFSWLHTSADPLDALFLMCSLNLRGTTVDTLALQAGIFGFRGAATV